MKKDSEQGGIIPIFPLPSTVFYPGTPLPLHIFEPRYRQMTADALEGERKIGMILLKPDWEAAYFDRPEVFPIGCVGSIEQEVCHPDGKYNFYSSWFAPVSYCERGRRKALPSRRNRSVGRKK